jgi:hypothetical protein
LKQNDKPTQIGSQSNQFELCSDHFSAMFGGHGVLNKDPTVWLDGARPPPKVFFFNRPTQKLTITVFLIFCGWYAKWHNAVLWWLKFDKLIFTRLVFVLKQRLQKVEKLDQKFLRLGQI